MSVIYPAENEHRLKKNPLWRLRYLLSFFEFYGKRKCFWLGFIVLLSVVFCLGCYGAYLNSTDLSVLIVTYPWRMLAIAKLLCIYHNRERVAYLLDYVTEEFWDIRIAGPSLERKVKRKFFQTSIVAVTITFLAESGALLFVNKNLQHPQNGLRPLPSYPWVPFDTDPSPLHEIVFGILLMVSCLIPCHTIFNAILLYSVSQLFVQFMLLNELIRNISVGIMDDKSDVERFNSDYFQKEVEKRVKICARHHHKLLQYGRNIQVFSNIILLTELLLSSLGVVVPGYNLLMHNSDIRGAVMFVSLLSTGYLLTVTIAIWSTQLKEQSLGIQNAVVSCKWYLFRSPIKRALVFILRNAENGITIKAGTIDVDHALLVDVTQKIFSCITLLKGLTEEDT